MPSTADTKGSPVFAAMKPPEELRVVSEKLMNFWVGAATPLWFPFMAATSFGIGTWALTQALQRQQELLKDIPGGGFSGFWLVSERASEALAVTEARMTKAAKAVTETVAPSPLAKAKVEAFSSPQVEASIAAAALMNESIELASKTIESVTEAVQAASKPVKKAVKAAVDVEPAKVVIPEVKPAKIEVPKVKPVKAEFPEVKPAEVAPPLDAAKAAAVKTADKVAKAMVDTAKPASRRRPARKA